MPRTSDFDRVKEIAAEARSEPSWKEFSDYCEFRGDGMRDSAMKALDRFLDLAVGWRVEERLAFARWVLPRSSDFFDARVLLPEPLRVRLVIPLIREWAALSPQCAEPHLWLGLIGQDDPEQHLERALRIDPSCALARKTLLLRILADVAYNQHELPGLYIHDPRLDLIALARALDLIEHNEADDTAANVRQEIMELKKRAEDWLARRPREGDFAQH